MKLLHYANDFKEIGVFYLFINPNDEGYGNQNSRVYGLKILQDANGLYQFEDPVFQTVGLQAPIPFCK